MSIENTIAQGETAGVAEHTRSDEYFRPNVDIVETADELVVLADVPGVGGNEVDVDFADGTLTIHGRAKPRQDEGTSYETREYGIGSFYRTFRVSEQVDAGKITAECADGVLTLHLPKIEAVKPRKIKVAVK